VFVPIYIAERESLLAQAHHLTVAGVVSRSGCHPAGLGQWQKKPEYVCN